MTSVELPTQAVVEKVAAANRVDPLKLQPPLFEAIDADALNSLIDSAGPQTTVKFTYCGYEVTIDGSCTVELEPVSGELESVRKKRAQSD